MRKERWISLSKGMVLCFMILTFLNTLLPDEFVRGLLYVSVYPDPWRMLLRWLSFVSFLVLPVATFFNRATFQRIAIYFCLPVAILCLLDFPATLAGYTSPLGTGLCDIRYLPNGVRLFMKNEIFRGILFFAIHLSEIGAILLLILRDPSVLKLGKRDILPFLGLIPLLSFSIVPTYALEGIFHTYTDIAFKAFTPAHFVWLACMVLEIAVLTLIFRRKPEEDRYILVLILSFSLLLQFNQLFASLGELTCKRMPLQLCNIATYLLPIALLKKNRSLFLFNLLINVPGGVIAAIVLDVGGNEGLLYWSNIHYIVEHNNVIVVPLLCLILGVFAPIKKRDFKDFVRDFTVYYLIVFVLGTLFNTLKVVLNSDYFYCNYLFMFDQETAARLIPFAGKLFNYQLHIGPVTIYPLLQALIYLAFFAIGTLAFFVLKVAVRERKPLAIASITK
ncbi:MAG: YwaF family protein [Clostridia bacterium]|nr:YwaF family protein [Clostridia bacterium]